MLLVQTFSFPLVCVYLEARNFIESFATPSFPPDSASTTNPLTSLLFLLQTSFSSSLPPQIVFFSFFFKPLPLFSLFTPLLVAISSSPSFYLISSFPLGFLPFPVNPSPSTQLSQLILSRRLRRLTLLGPTSNHTRSPTIAIPPTAPMAREEEEEDKEVKALPSFLLSTLDPTRGKCKVGPFIYLSACLSVRLYLFADLSACFFPYTGSNCFSVCLFVCLLASICLRLLPRFTSACLLIFLPIYVFPFIFLPMSVCLLAFCTFFCLTIHIYSKFINLISSLYPHIPSNRPRWVRLHTPFYHFLYDCFEKILEELTWCLQGNPGVGGGNANDVSRAISSAPATPMTTTSGNDGVGIEDAVTSGVNPAPSDTSSAGQPALIAATSTASSAIGNNLMPKSATTNEIAGY